MSLAGFKIIDADGHVTEPASLYSTHIDPKFRAAADALLSRVGAGNLGIVPALYPKWRSAERPLGEANEVAGLGKLPSGRNHPLASPAGGYDPAERIRDMDKEGIDVAVCFATVATSVCAATDPAMEAALARAYNRWVGEYCGAFPARIKAVGIVPQREMDPLRRGGRVSRARAVGGRHHDLRQSRRDAPRPSVFRPALSKPRRTLTCRSVFTAAPIGRRSRPGARMSATTCS